jgi:hypothetical protein
MAQVISERERPIKLPNRLAVPKARIEFVLAIGSLPSLVGSKELPSPKPFGVITPTSSFAN